MDKKIILIVSDGTRTAAMINGNVISGAQSIAFTANGFDVSLDINGVTPQSFSRFTEKDFWEQVKNILSEDFDSESKPLFESISGQFLHEDNSLV